MASHIERPYNAEDPTASPTDLKHAQNIPPQPPASARRVLSNVSPNVRKTSVPSATKPLTGSPLKRSFRGTIEGGEGHTYLKRRKLSSDEFLISSSESRDPYTTIGQDPYTTIRQDPTLVDGTGTETAAAKFQAFLQPDETVYTNS